MVVFNIDLVYCFLHSGLLCAVYLAKVRRNGNSSVNIKFQYRHGKKIKKNVLVKYAIESGCTCIAMNFPSKFCNIYHIYLFLHVLVSHCIHVYIIAGMVKTSA